VLEDAGLLVRETDLFRENRSSYRIAEPLISFYHAVMRPAWGQLERPGSGGRVWRVARHRFESNVLGPRFEQICREWCLLHADDETFGGLPARVGHGTVSDAANRATYEVDVAVVGLPDGGKPPLLAIGEAKWGEVMGLEQLRRLDRVRSRLGNQSRYDTSRTRLVCFSGAGFTADLRAAADSGQAVLVGLHTLYG
jgi:uncharacterized protein